MKKTLIFVAFVIFGFFCALSGFYFGQNHLVAVDETVKPSKPVKLPKPKTPQALEHRSIPVLGCAIKHGKCECYGRKTPDFDFMDDGIMEFDLSVCEDYIKRSGGSRYITIPQDGIPDGESRKRINSLIYEKLKQFDKK